MMARKNKDGQIIISAAEVGTYTVCPESWRLRVVEGLERTDDFKTIEMGNQLHNKWAEQNAEAIFFKRGINILLLLFANALVLGLYLLDYR
jgi:hypothetical protein